MILAEELDADWSQVKLQHAPANELYGNPIFIIQATGGSTSVRAFWKPLREALAPVRVPCWCRLRPHGRSMPQAARR